MLAVTISEARHYGIGCRFRPRAFSPASRLILARVWYRSAEYAPTLCHAALASSCWLAARRLQGRRHHQRPQPEIQGRQGGRRVAAPRTRSRRNAELEDPLGQEDYFDRSRFDADLKRIQAFYADRGYPDARVTGFDVKLNDKQDAVDVTVTIAEGEPVKVAAVNFVGFDVIPPQHLDDLEERGAAQSRAAARSAARRRDARAGASTSCKDHGYPVRARSRPTRTTAPTGSRRRSPSPPSRASSRTSATIEIAGNKSVSDHVIRRELTFKPGDLYQRSLLQDSQRRLYGMELFQFANVEPLNPGTAAGRTCRSRVDGRRRASTSA